MKRISLFLLVTLLYSCVGTLQDSAEDVGKASLTKSFAITFDGVIKESNPAVHAVSHNKVSLRFKPASGGSGQFSYLVYQDGGEASVSSASGNNLNINADGSATIYVSGLQVGRTYSFIVRAYDQVNKVTDTNTVEELASTLTFKVPDFNGLTSATPLGGVLGKTTIELEWSPALKPAGEVVPGTDPNDITGYYIWYAKTEAELKTKTNRDTPVPPDATQIYTNPTTGSLNAATQVNGLDQGTDYYFLVRAKNNQTPPKTDFNSIIKKARTKTSEPIIFSGLSTLTVPTDITGLTTVNFTWKAGTGDFNEYWLFLWDNPVVTTPDPTPAAAAQFLGIYKISNTALTSYSWINLTAHRTYYASVIACNTDNSCAAPVTPDGRTVVKNVKTTPPISTFAGLTSVTRPSGDAGLSSLDLAWNLPDSAVGIFDNFAIYLTDSNGVINATPLPLCGGANTNPCLETALTKTTSLKRVLNLTKGTQYCFKAALTLGGQLYQNGAPKLCGTADLVMANFSGPSGCSNSQPTTFNVDWSAPTGGLYSSFELWYREGVPADLNTSTFSFNDSSKIANGGTFNVITGINSANNTYLISSLSPNKEYIVGVRAVYYYAATNEYFYKGSYYTNTCKTTDIKPRSFGWDEVFAIGPRVIGQANILSRMQGQMGFSGTIIPERLALADAKKNNISTYPATASATNLDFPEFRYPTVASVGCAALAATDQPNNPGDQCSSGGIVRFTWKDFYYDSVGRYMNYYSDDGYNVYRIKFNKSSPNIPNYTSPLWGSPLNQNIIKAAINTKNSDSWDAINNGATQYIAEFIDYSVKSDPTDTTIYFYKVVPVTKLPDNTYKELSYGNDPTLGRLIDDRVLKVSVPPYNMALVHRWMANKISCETLRKNYDRENNYRCEFNGAGSRVATFGGSKKTFYDYGGHSLIDRNKLGCNFSNTCGASNDQPCIGTSDPRDASINGTPNSIYYNSSNQRCYINRSGYPVRGSIAGTIWVDLIHGGGDPNHGYFIDLSRVVDTLWKRDPGAQQWTVGNWHGQPAGSIAGTYSTGTYNADGSKSNTYTDYNRSWFSINADDPTCVDSAGVYKTTEACRCKFLLYDFRPRSTLNGDRTCRAMQLPDNESLIPFNGDLPGSIVKDNKYTSGLGLGSLIGSNNSQLPPLLLPRNLMHRTCQAMTVRHYNLTNNTDTYMRKRLMRRFEMLPAVEFSPYHFNAQFETNLLDDNIHGYNGIYASSRFNGCFTATNERKGFSTGVLSTSATLNNVTNVGTQASTVWPYYYSTNLDSDTQTALATGAFDGNSSTGQRSQELCTSRFGVGEVFGGSGYWEWTSDTYNCQTGRGCVPNSYKTIFSTNPTTGLNYTYNWSSAIDPENKKFLRSGPINPNKRLWMEFLVSESSIGKNPNMEYDIWSWDPDSGKRQQYYNPAIGMFLRCKDDTCGINEDDDNTLALAGNYNGRAPGVDNSAKFDLKIATISNWDGLVQWYYNNNDGSEDRFVVVGGRNSESGINNYNQAKRRSKYFYSLGWGNSGTETPEMYGPISETANGRCAVTIDDDPSYLDPNGE